MKLSILLVVLAVTALVVSAQVTAPPSSHRALYAQAHAEAHSIQMETLLETKKCSATAVGPHALLSAAHCELGTDELELDGYTVEVGGTIRDGRDHTIFILPKIKFKDYAVINQTLPEQGDEIFYFGNPDKVKDWFRKGYVVNVQKPEGLFSSADDPIIIDYDSNGYYGDSGAGIFNERGEVETVVTAGIMVHKTADATADSLTAKFMQGLAMTFTAEQLERAAQ